jgi:hypothetical protein
MTELGARKRLRLVGGRQIEQPTFEATIMERMAIKRFLKFAQEDIKFQFDEMNREAGVSRETLHEAQHTAALLSTYLGKLREGIDRMTGTLAPESANIPAEPVDNSPNCA